MQIEVGGVAREDQVKVLPQSVWARFLVRNPRVRTRAAVGVGGAVAVCVMLALLLRDDSPNLASIHVSPVDQVVVSGSSLSFFAIGDWGRHGVLPQRQVAAAMAAYAAVMPPRFIAAVGDNAYENGVVSVEDESWESSWRGVYNHPSLAAVPWLAILGNHDYRSNISAPTLYNRDARWVMPDLNFTRTWQLQLPGAALRGSGDAAGATACVRTVFVNTCPQIAAYRTDKYHDKRNEWFQRNLNASDPDEDLLWLQQELADGAAACAALIVVGHHPVYSPGIHGDSDDLQLKYKPLFDASGVDAYVSGHDHTLAHLSDAAGANSDSVAYTVTGAGSTVRDNSEGTPKTRFVADESGFTIHSANATHYRVAYIRGLDGAALFTHTQPLRRKAGRL